METDASTKRILIETNVIDGNVAETFTFSQAETLHLDFVAYTANQKRIKMPEGGSCKMEAWIDGTPATLYVQKTGTVNTTTRKATVTLSRAESNMPVGDYLFTVKVFDSDDLLTGIIARGTMTALYAPDSDNVDYVGTAPAVTGVWGNITGTLSDQTDLQSAINAKQDILAEGAFVDGDKTKLDGIEALADVTDTANVTSAGALMDSEVTNLAQVKAFDSADYLGATAQAVDVDPAGTAIAGALLAKANDNAVVKLTGETLQTVEGSITVGNLIKTMNGAGAIVGSNINVISSVELVSADGWRIRQGGDNAILENLRDLGNLYLRAFVSGNTAGDLYLNDIGGNTIVPILKALATTGLVVQNSAGTEKLKVGAATGADVQVTGDLSVTEKQATAYQNTDTRTATMTGDETLTISSAICQFLDPADSDRNLDLPDSSLFVVQNTGDGGEIITVRDSSDVTIDTVDNGVTLTFIYDGTNWQVLG
jgi:hypothetical protein